MKSVEELESELEELRKEFYFFSKGKSQGGESSGTTTPTPSPQPSGDDGWTLIYDKDSDDPELNLGEKEGIYANYGTFSNLPDLNPYTKLRVVFLCSSSEEAYDFDIATKVPNNLRMMKHNGYMTQIFGGDISVEYEGTKKVLWIGPITELYLRNNKYPSLTSLNSQSTIRYIKFYVK